MHRLAKFPKEWKEVVHCTKRFDYSSYDETDARHSRSPFVEQSQWHGVVSLVHPQKEFGLVVPHKLFEYNSELFAQLRKGGNWFVFSLPRITADCSSCDGQTDSSFSVKEYGGIHDLLWNHFSDREREELGLFLWDNEECKYPESLQEFQEFFPKESISWIFS